MGAFNRLPTELLFMIMSHLDRKDKKTFRLLDPRCSPMPLPILFRSIGFSRLRRDRDAFEMIAAHPHLAVHVRELVWWELQLEAWDPSYLHNEEGFYDDVEDDCDLMREEILTAAFQDPAVFWLPKFNGTAWVEEALGYRPKFVGLVKKNFPHLATFASEPMLGGNRGGGREIVYRGYPLSTDLFTLNFSPENLGGNGGLWSYLLTAMADEEEQGQLNITSLRVVDERFTCLSLLHNVQMMPPLKAFGTLTSLDLCLASSVLVGFPRADYGSSGDTPVLNACLRAAKELRHLRLCFRESRVDAHPNAEARARRPLVTELLTGCFWPHLSSFHLEGFPPFPSLPPSRWHDFFDKHLVSLFKQHAASLRSLKLQDYLMEPRGIRQLRSAGLHLESLRLTWPGHNGCLVEEGSLLAYVNNAAEGCATSYGELASMVGDMAETVVVTENDGALEGDEVDQEWLSCTIWKPEEVGVDQDDQDGAGAGDGDADDGDKYDSYKRQTPYTPPSDRAAEDYIGLLYGEYKLDRKRTAAANTTRRDSDHQSNGHDDDNNHDDDEEEDLEELATTRRWIFNHRDGREVEGGDPLEYFSDWDSDEGDESTPYV